jgi:hypothetical protein
MELGQFSSPTRIAQGPEAHRAGRIGGTSGMARPHACRFGTLAGQDRTGNHRPYTPYTTLGRAAGLSQRVTPAKTPDCRSSGGRPATHCVKRRRPQVHREPGCTQLSWLPQARPPHVACEHLGLRARAGARPARPGVEADGCLRGTASKPRAARPPPGRSTRESTAAERRFRYICAAWFAVRRRSPSQATNKRRATCRIGGWPGRTTRTSWAGGAAASRLASCRGCRSLAAFTGWMSGVAQGRLPTRSAATPTRHLS